MMTTSTETTSATSDGTATTTSDAGTDGTEGTEGTGTDGTEGTGTTGDGINTEPVAVDDLYLTNTMVGTLEIDAASGVLDNDEDPDADALVVDTFDAVSTAGGTVAVNDDGSFAYTPVAGYYGDDRFEYTISDGRGGTATAEVRIMVAPTLEAGAGSDVVIEGEIAGQRSGASVGGNFDIDGDGLEDVVVGAPGTSAASILGGAYAVFANASTIDLSAVAGGTGGFVMTGVENGSLTGSAVALLGDVNGDGLGDIAVGAPAEGDRGVVYVVFGKADGSAVDLTAVAGGTGGFVVTGDTSGDRLGLSVGAAGDVNGDGLADLVMGAPQTDPDEGFAAVVFGRTATTAIAISDLGVGSTLGYVLFGESSVDAAGFSVVGAGDTNGDGFDDLVVSAPTADPGAVNAAGRVYVVFGSSSDANVALSTIAAGTGGWVLDGTEDSDTVGQSVGAAGDVNGDGRADFIVGAIGDEGAGQANTGRAYVVFGKTTTTAVTVATIGGGTGGFAITGESQFNLAGSSVAGAGDVNGDGFADVVVGASNAFSQRGRAYVVYGKSTTSEVSLAEIAAGLGGYALVGDAINNNVGISVAGAGDLDGDGFDDVITGAFRADPSAGADAGRSYVIFGGDYLGLTAGDATFGDDDLVGTSSAETIIGGLGNDTLSGEGGNDVLFGGPGDDVVAIPTGTAFFRLDGGTGVDTLQLTGADLTLDLTAVSDLAIVGFEVVDITGSGDNTLTLAVRDIRALSPTSNVLVVVGDDGDTVNADLQAAGFVDNGSAGGFTTYSNGVLSLVVDDDLVASIQL